jgi:hypothetical protein
MSDDQEVVAWPHTISSKQGGIGSDGHRHGGCY